MHDRDAAVVAALREALAEAKRKVEWYDKRLAEALSFYGGAEPNEPNVSSNGDGPAKAAIVRPKNRTSWAPRAGGPTETVLSVVKENPGIRESYLLDMAEQRVEASTNRKRDSVRESVRNLLHQKRLEYKGGGYYLPAQ